MYACSPLWATWLLILLSASIYVRVATNGPNPSAPCRRTVVGSEKTVCPTTRPSAQVPSRGPPHSCWVAVLTLPALQWGVVLDDAGSTDVYDDEDQARAAARATGGVVVHITTTVTVP